MRHFLLLSAAMMFAFLAGCSGSGKEGGSADAGCDCGQDHAAEKGEAHDSAAEPQKKSGEPSEPANPLASPRESIRHQVKLLLEGRTEELKMCLTERLRDRITPEMVSEGAKEGSNLSFEEIYASDSMEEYEGLQVCKVKMRNGRTLTTLVLEDGRWLADTIWFK